MGDKFLIKLINRNRNEEKIKTITAGRRVFNCSYYTHSTFCSTRNVSRTTITYTHDFRPRSQQLYCRCSRDDAVSNFSRARVKIKIVYSRRYDFRRVSRVRRRRRTAKVCPVRRPRSCFLPPSASRRRRMALHCPDTTGPKKLKTTFTRTAPAVFCATIRRIDSWSSA